MDITGPIKAMPKANAKVSGRRLALAAIMVLALITAALALPRMAGGLLLALAPGVREDSSYPQPDEAAAAQPWLTWSLLWHDSAHTRLYDALFKQISGQPSEEKTLSAMLAQSPLRPRQWLRLAQIRAATGDEPGAIAAWRMSVFAARHEPSVMEDRLDLGLSLKSAMIEDDLALLDDQFKRSFVLLLPYVQRVMDKPHNAPHKPYYRSIVDHLSTAEIDHMVRIHALH